MSTPPICTPDIAELHPDETSGNRKFACHHDIKLLLQITFASPWEADHGKHASLRKSGTAEEYEEREHLLQDIKTRMDDFKASETIRQDVCRGKLEGIENSGTLLRKMTLGELERSSQEEAGTQKRKKRKATAPSIDMNNLIHAIQAGIDDKHRREELITEQSAARLEFDREQAAIRAEQHHANQLMMMKLISAIAKRIE
ncbi:hypothetical protein H310_10580 [Aphanomyces invadans]|uniref:No apical meristem-associated C-terminal domain-containing protein n=1 Tax=Aphanomyces invadans TaxID=157072 RepID=A0A024TP69_9STRA|nr:hypothetical protein H310_10580 [Aphanomyces invadans]ETV95915.1 hypothetical protein H310_10580 [Aphanomyces invadans]|eukprot:XP_008875226.1 hypothetical protein H310_10580 [Aphanomyces invadans]